MAEARGGAGALPHSWRRRPLGRRCRTEALFGPTSAKFPPKLFTKNDGAVPEPGDTKFCPPKNVTEPPLPVRFNRWLALPLPVSFHTLVPNDQMTAI